MPMKYFPEQYFATHSSSAARRGSTPLRAPIKTEGHKSSQEQKMSFVVHCCMRLFFGR